MEHSTLAVAPVAAEIHNQLLYQKMEVLEL
jgi:hypothetical protein